MTTPPPPVPAPAKVSAQPGRGGHGREIRGEMLPRRSDFFEGRFGRLFRTLPPAQHTIPMLAKLADKMAADAEAEETPDTEQDAEENNHIPSGYTYLGQFIDHDLTFDPNSSLQKQNDLEALVDFRTPRFDLDCVYGRGPNDQPYMYRDDNFFLFGRRLSGSTFDKNTRDLPRNNPDPLGTNRTNARALIGDPRNDENVIVSQLQGIFMRFHNHVAAEMLRKNPQVEFKDIQQMVRWHYQWVILHDFLPRILDIEVLKHVLPGYKRHRPFDDCFKPNLEFFKWKNSAFIPIEFTTAAYRFGHSMIRPIYRLNSTLPGRFHIFSSNPLDSLVGFREFPDVWAIDWRLYFPIEKRPVLGPDRVQPAYKIDTSIVNPLKTLPNPVVAPKPEVERNLAYRNLVRGLQMSLPSGQAVARKLCVKQLTDAQLVVGKATGDPEDEQIPLVSIDPAFADNAPLWYYILAEAQVNRDDTKLRGVGARIVAEVFVGLLSGDSHSFLAQYPSWCPPEGPEFDMPALIRQAILTKEP